MVFNLDALSVYISWSGVIFIYILGIIIEDFRSVTNSHFNVNRIYLRHRRFDYLIILFLNIALLIVDFLFFYILTLAAFLPYTRNSTNK